MIVRRLPTLTELCRYPQDAGTVEPPEAACIAVAGPVSQNKVTMTNRNWVIDGSEVRR